MKLCEQTDSSLNIYPLDVPGYYAGFTLRQDKSGRIQNAALHTCTAGDSVLQDILSFRQKICMESGYGSLITLQQTHFTEIHLISQENISSFLANPLIPGDGIFTDQADILCGILTADCIPILYGAVGKQVCGAVHAGWKGLNAKIHLRALEILYRNYKVEPQSVYITLGPHIHQCCYQVGEDFQSRFPLIYFKKQDGDRYLDLSAICINELKEAGVPADQISDSGICTGHEDQVFSYRRGDTCHRTLSIIGFK